MSLNSWANIVVNGTVDNYRLQSASVACGGAVCMSKFTFGDEKCQALTYVFIRHKAFAAVWAGELHFAFDVADWSCQVDRTFDRSTGDMHHPTHTSWFRNWVDREYGAGWLGAVTPTTSRMEIRKALQVFIQGQMTEAMELWA